MSKGRDVFPPGTLTTLCINATMKHSEFLQTGLKDEKEPFDYFICFAAVRIAGVLRGPGYTQH
jgi:hypothetical protein